MAEEIGVDQSQLTKALNLAKLPVDVINAFPSPLDLQYRWSSDLVAAIQRDPDFVLERARETQSAIARPSAKDVFARLIEGRGTVPQSSKEPVMLSGKGKQKAALVFDSVNEAVQIKLSNVPSAKFEKLQSIIKEFLSK